MVTQDSLTEALIRATHKDVITFLMNMNFLLREMQCKKCFSFSSFVFYKKTKDEYVWRCMKKAYSSSKK